MSDHHISQGHDSEAVDMAPACISAISETESMILDNRCLFPGYQLHVYPLYTEFTSKENTKPLKEAKDINYDSSVNVPLVTRKKRQQKKDGMTFLKYNNPDLYEKRLYQERKNSSTSPTPKRGQITGMSKKSSLRLRKRAARIEDLSLWIDLTFADDTLYHRTITERAQFSYYCLKRLTKYVKDKFNLHLIWKRENKPRKSGKNTGEIMPHFHVLFGGMTQKQYSKWISISIQILMRWVQITGTDSDDALAVAINKKSFRRIENPKHATCYISKYFSKDEPLEIPEGESIGRCWGKSSNCPDVQPYIINLTQQESFKLVRHLIRKKRLITKKGRFIKNQLQNGHPTFLFEDEADIGRFLDFIDVDMFPDVYPDIVPF